MQQTETYNLNLIETSDPFSPAPLNENAEKTEAALAAEAQARAAETQARAAADAALDSRVTVLEGHKVRMATGTYTGSGSASRTFKVGFAPRFAIVKRVENSLTWMAVENQPYKDSNGNMVVQFVGNTLWLSSTVNASSYTYYFIVFG